MTSASSSSSSTSPVNPGSDQPSLSDLLEAMPIDECELDERVDSVSPSGAQQTALQKLLADLALRPVPTNRLSRLWILGSLQAKIGAAYFAWWLRKWYASADAREKQLNETHLKAAFRMLGGMSYLRGAAMKFGQVLANFPKVLPTEFAEVLGSLHFEAPPMHFSLLREFVRKELGADPEDLFEEFESEAFAAASLGQVHRARLKGSGRPVAVKVQYPNIARTIETDLKNLKAIFVPMRMHPDWDSLLDGYEDIRFMLGLECDYEHEAKNLRIARDAFRDRDDIVVPEVHDEWSTRRVLIMDYLEGKHLRAYLETNPSQAERNEFARRITYSHFRLSYGHHLLYADPHPGNYLFMDDGRLGLLDFGCCVQYSDEHVDYVEDVERAYLSGDPDEMRRVLIRGGRLSEKQQQDETRMQLMHDWAEWVWEPSLVDDGEEFDFGDASYFKRGAEIYGELCRRQYVRSEPLNTWLTRSFFGVRAILTELEAKFDYREIWKEHSDRYVMKGRDDG